MTMTFNVVDVETANSDRSSICSIGIINVQDGKIANKWSTLVNPETGFEPKNISIHGIKEEDVKHSPTLPMIYDELCSQVDDSILVSHSPFDKTAFERALKRYNLEQLRVTWLDSVLIARRAWPEKYGRDGADLGNIAKDLGISFNHHDALEDARAAAEIVLRACKDTGIDIEGWLRRV